MAFTAAVEKARQEALAQANNSAGNGFQGDVRVFDLTSLEKGDKVKIEFNNEDVINQKMGEREVDGKKEPIIAQYIVLQTEGGKVVNFYPSVFTKARKVYNADGTPTSLWARTGGTAAAEYKKHESVQEAMEALKGRTIEVTDSVSVHTKAYGRNEFVDTNILTIDLV